MAVQAAAPAPLPSSPFTSNVSSALPVPPPVPDKLLNLHKSPRYYVHNKTNSHGKQWIAACLADAGLAGIDSTFLPNDNTAFFWVQREFQFQDYDLFTGNENNACIGFCPSQGVVCDKSRFAATLYRYYGDDAWQVTPLTVDIAWDTTSLQWVITDRLRTLMASKSSNFVWITKSSLGSLGSNIFIFRGNNVDEFAQFITAKYNPVSWGQRLEATGCTNLGVVEFKSIIVQEYIQRPLLYKGRYKFDLRVYALLASTNPCMLFYHLGKMRVCGVEYSDLRSVDEDDMQAMMQSMGNEEDDVDNGYNALKYGHLSNCKIQRSHENYDHGSSSIDGQTMLNDWNAFVRFMFHVAVQRKQFSSDWFETHQHRMDSFTLQDMKQLIDAKCARLLAQCYSASKAIFDAESVRYNRPCQFMFHGCDILIGADGAFRLLECNRQPSLSLIGHASIKNMTKAILKEAIDIMLEIREMKNNGQMVDQNTALKAQQMWLTCKLDYTVPLVQRIENLVTDLDKLL